MVSDYGNSVITLTLTDETRRTIFLKSLFIGFYCYRKLSLRSFIPALDFKKFRKLIVTKIINLTVLLSLVVYVDFHGFDSSDENFFNMTKILELDIARRISELQIIYRGSPL